MNNIGDADTQDIGLIYMNARYYLPEVGRFASPDTLVPDPGNPQSFNRYSYTRNNPVNLTDPTGHRETDGCENSGCSLGSSPDNYLWQLPDSQLVPWDPSQSQSRYDAIAVGASANIAGGAIGPVGMNGSIGFELLLNSQSQELTSFLYVSGGAGGATGASGNLALYVGGVKNLGSSNYDYRGPTRSVSAVAAAGPLGITAGTSTSLGDNPLNPQGVYTEYIGWAPGIGASLTVSDAQYVPIFTNNLDDGSSSWDILKYAGEGWQEYLDLWSQSWNDFHTAMGW